MSVVKDGSCDTLCSFIIIGIEVSTPDGAMEAHAIILICSVDLSAQAKVLNMKQYNGKFACPMCEDEGVPRPRAPMIRNWPFNPSSTFQTHNLVMGNAKKAIDEGHAVCIVYCSHQMYIVYICMHHAGGGYFSTMVVADQSDCRIHVHTYNVYGRCLSRHLPLEAVKIYIITLVTASFECHQH